LNYYNRNDNALTRLFSIEYALWFDCLLPALDKLYVPIPLGGTSNIFRTDILREIGAWDPFNVTEDADLGLRLAANGYCTRMIDSTTFEEATCGIQNWIRQRSRWIKGYMQTWLVHSRHPFSFMRQVGIKGLLTTQLFVAGNVISVLVNPVLWIIFLAWQFAGATTIERLFPGPLLTVNLWAFFLGNGLLILMTLLAPLRRGWTGISLNAVFMPIYWMLSSVSGYLALTQLVAKPHFWEKTDHMVSHSAKARRDEIIGRKITNTR